jgi:hypothetical protein
MACAPATRRAEQHTGHFKTVLHLHQPRRRTPHADVHRIGAGQSRTGAGGAMTEFARERSVAAATRGKGDAHGIARQTTRLPERRRRFMRWMIGWSTALVFVAAATPSFAQISLVGEWSPRYHEDQPDRIPGPELGDYTGLPITEGARLAADTWDASRLTLREHQCKVHNGPYILHGPIQFRLWEEKDLRTQALIAIRMYLNTYEQERTIWMDGRPHPPEYAPHTFQGFSTGKWEGDILTVYTTHIKQEWIRRNGVPNSEKSTMVEHFIRHGNILTHLEVWSDPVYLSEPLIRSEDFVFNDHPGGNWLWPCEYVDEIVDRPHSAVPSYLPGKSPFEGDFAYRFGVPVEAAKGGAETTYPEYQEKLRTLPKPPKPAAAAKAAAETRPAASK